MPHVEDMRGISQRKPRALTSYPYRLRGSSEERCSISWILAWISLRRQDRAAVRQIAQMVLECSESRDRLAVDLEARHAIGDALLGIREHRKHIATHLFARRASRLGDAGQVLIDLLRSHNGSVAATSMLPELTIAPGGRTQQRGGPAIG